MQLRRIVLLLIGAIMLLTCVSSAFVVPQVYLPTTDPVVSTGSTESTVDWYQPAPPCYECMPEPTPAPVYETIGLTASVSSTKVRMNSNVNFAGTQISGTPVLSTTPWQWIIQPPKGAGYGKNGQVVTVKVSSFGRWHINLAVRDSVQMLNGHWTGNFNIAEKR